MRCFSSQPSFLKTYTCKAGDLPCRGARGTLSGGQCEGAPCLSLFPKEVGWLGIRKHYEDLGTVGGAAR